MHVTSATRATGGFAGTTPATPGARSAQRSFKDTLTAESTPASKPETPAAKAEAPASQIGTTPAVKADASATKAPHKGPKGERTDDVKGHAYDEIVAGPRNGMFLNMSGNARHGKAFTLVERNGWEYHIYGTGRTREIFRVKDPEATQKGSSEGTSGTTKDSPATTSPTTGATPATT